MATHSWYDPQDDREAYIEGRMLYLGYIKDEDGEWVMDMDAFWEQYDKKCNVQPGGIR